MYPYGHERYLENSFVSRGLFAPRRRALGIPGDKRCKNVTEEKVQTNHSFLRVRGRSLKSETKNLLPTQDNLKDDWWKLWKNHKYATLEWTNSRIYQILSTNYQPDERKSQVGLGSVRNGASSSIFERTINWNFQVYTVPLSIRIEKVASLSSKIVCMADQPCHCKREQVWENQSAPGQKIYFSISYFVSCSAVQKLSLLFSFTSKNGWL